MVTQVRSIGIVYRAHSGIGWNDIIGGIIYDQITEPSREALVDFMTRCGVSEENQDDFLRKVIAVVGGKEYFVTPYDSEIFRYNFADDSGIQIHKHQLVITSFQKKE